jgi:Arc/MetJ-type ribon-helix-helix transcriptional regulator
MTVNLRPEVERELEERLKAGIYSSTDETISDALEKYMGMDLPADELNRLLDEGEEDIAAGRVVPGAEVTRLINEWSQTGRNGS